MGLDPKILWNLVPNYACSLCYAIFSLWGFITLLVVGLGLSADYRKIDYQQLPADEVDSVAVQSYIAAAIYLACVAGCGARFLYLHLKQRNLQKERLLRQIPSVEEV